MMEEAETNDFDVKCRAYSSWDPDNNSWRSDSDGDTSLTIVESPAEEYVILVVMRDQDVVERINVMAEEDVSMIAAHSSILVVVGDHRFRLELQDPEDVIRVFDKLHCIKQPTLKLRCLETWQREIIRDKILSIASNSEAQIDTDSVSDSPVIQTVEEILENLLRDNVKFSKVRDKDINDTGEANDLSSGEATQEK